MSRTILKRSGFFGRLFPRLVVHIYWSTDKIWHVDQNESMDRFNMFLYFGSVDKGDGSGDSGLMIIIWKLRILWGWADESGTKES